MPLWYLPSFHAHDIEALKNAVSRKQVKYRHGTQLPKIEIAITISLNTGTVTMEVDTYYGEFSLVINFTLIISFKSVTHGTN